MAESEPAAEASSSSIPDYEYVDVNTAAFHIGSFREEWLKRLKPEQISFQLKDQDTFEANFAAEMGLEEETMAELRSVCSVDSLRCYSEDQQPDPEVLPSEPTLKTLIYRKKKQRRSSSYRGGQNRHELYAGELDRLTIGRAPESEADMVPEGELILSINIYFPVNFDKFNYMRPHVTLLMRGSQTLAELRDAIFCVSDLQVCGEFSNTPDLAPDFICKDLFKSAFFFFEGVFYDDMRHPDCQDISRTTIKWSKSNNYPPFSQAKMEDTRWVDLRVKLGYPYLYCHQGDCEHLVIITDIRLVHQGDCLDKRLYPLLTHKNRAVTQKCAVCHVFIGRWYTIGDQFAPSDPCIFCDKCFRMLHYDEQGIKLGEFLAYPYVDRGAFN